MSDGKEPGAADRSEGVSEPSPQPKNTYGDILKSSVLVGGSQVLGIAFRIVRAKAMALLLGPTGFGLFSIYGSVLSVAQGVTEMGINSSGVRQIAEAVGSGDRDRIALTSAVLRRTSFVLGAIGSLFLFVLSRQLSRLTFGSTENNGAIALLSFALLLQLISDGQGALIQGMRRIADLAKMGVLGALGGTVISIAFVYFGGERGIVPSIIGAAGMSLLGSWWYARKIAVDQPFVTLRQLFGEIAALLKLGSAFMITGFLAVGIGYFVRIMLVRKTGLEGAGVYQAAWTLGGLYSGFILQAMGADFYPRLAANAHDNGACNRLVNEQTRVGMLLAGPGVIATLGVASLVIAVFYSGKFAGAVPILRWICLGTMLQVITWPMGYIIVAKARQGIYLGTETAWAVCSVAFAWICVKWFGAAGAGMAFFGSYVCYGLLLYPVVRRLSGFRWSAPNKRTGLVFLCLIAMVFSGFYVLPFVYASWLGVVAAALSGTYSLRVLLGLMDVDQIPSPIRRLRRRLALHAR